MVKVLDQRIAPIILGLIGATLLTSIVAALDARSGGNLYRHLALLPIGVWHGQLWRLATWTFVERSPFALVFACGTLAWFGGDLVSVWGTRRFARFVVGVVLVAGVGTSLLALALSGARWHMHLGGLALGDALVVAWALQFPLARIRVYQHFVVGGRLLAYGTVAMTALLAVYYGLPTFLPELLAGVAALVYMTRPSRRWWLLLRQRYLGWRLGAVRGGRHGGPYSKA